MAADSTYYDWEVLFDDAAIARRVQELGREISRDFAGREFTVVCVLNGAVFFAVDLLRQFAFDTKGDMIFLEVVKARSYAGTASGALQVDLTLLEPRHLRGKHVLLIDDILDTGQTLATLIDRLREFAPASLKTAVLLEKTGALDPRFPIQADYIGFRVERDAFVVGYGLDYDGRYRNLQDIRRFGGPALE